KPASAQFLDEVRMAKAIERQSGRATSNYGRSQPACRAAVLQYLARGKSDIREEGCLSSLNCSEKQAWRGICRADVDYTDTVCKLRRKQSPIHQIRRGFDRDSFHRVTHNCPTDDSAGCQWRIKECWFDRLQVKRHRSSFAVGNTPAYRRRI